jgi:hypothetical protein
MYDLVVYTESAGRNILIGVGENEAALSALVVRDNVIETNTELHVGGLLRLEGDVQMTGGFRIDDGLTVKGGPSSFSEGKFEVKDLNGQNTLFFVDETQENDGNAVIVANRTTRIASNLTVDEDFTVKGDMNLEGSVTTSNLGVMSNITVGIDANVGGRLYVDGAMSVNESAGLEVLKDTRLRGGLVVDGIVAFGGGGYTLSSVSGDVIMAADSNRVDVMRDMKVECNLAVSQNATVSGTLEVEGAFQLTSNITVTGNSIFNGTLVVHPDPESAFSSDAFVVNDQAVLSFRTTEMACNLSVDGSASIGGDFVLSSGAFSALDAGNVNIGRHAFASCNVTVEGAVSAKGDLLVGEQGSRAFHVDVSNNELIQCRLPVVARCNLNVEGDAALQAALMVQGDADFFGDVVLSDQGGLTLEGGELRVKPRSSSQGGSNITALLVSDGIIETIRDVNMRSNLDVVGRIRVTDGGGAIITGGLSVSSGTFVTESGSFEADDASGVAVRREMNVHCNLAVMGSTTVDGGDFIVTPNGTNVVFAVTEDGLTCHSDVELKQALLVGGRTDFEGDVSVNPSGSAGGEVVFVGQGRVDVNQNLTVNDDTSINGDFTVSTNGSLAFRVLEASVYVHRDLDVTCNVIMRGDVEVSGGYLEVEGALGNGVVFSANDVEVKTSRPLRSEAEFVAETDVTVQGTLRVNPGGFGSVFTVNESNITTSLDATISGYLDVNGDVTVSSGSFTVFPSGSEVVSVTDIRMRVLRDLLLEGDVRFTGDEFTLINGGAGQSNLAMSVSSGLARFDRNIVANSNLTVNGSATFRENVNFEGIINAKGDVEIDSNLTVKGDALVEGDTHTTGNFLIYRAPQTVGGSNALVASITPSYSVINSETELRGPLSVYSSSAATTRVLHVRTTRVNVNKPLYVIGNTDVRGTSFTVGKKDPTAGDVDYVAANDTEVVFGRDARARCNVYVEGALSVDSDATVNGNAHVVGTMSVPLGDATFGRDVSVGGNANVNSNLDVTGTVVTEGGTFHVKDPNLGSLFFVDNDGTIAYRDTTVQSNLTVTENLRAEGGSFVVDGSNMHVSRDMNVQGSTKLTGDTFEVIATPSSQKAMLVTDSNIGLHRNVQIHGNTRMSDTLDVGGSVHLSSGVLTVGDSNRNVAAFSVDRGSNVLINRDAYVGSNLQVQCNVEVGGNADVDGALFVQNTIETQSNLIVNSLTDLYGPLRVRVGGTRAMEVEDSSVVFRRNAQANSNLTVFRDMEVRGKGLVQDEFTVQPSGSNTPWVFRVTTEDVTAEKDMTIRSNLNVVRDVDVGRDVTVQRNVSVNGELNASNIVAGSVVANCNVSVSGDLVVNPGNGTDVLIVESNLIRMLRNVDITGNTSISAGSFEVTKGGTLSMAVDESIAVINRDLDVNGDVNVQDNLTVGNNMTIAFDMTVGNDLTVNSNLTVKNDLVTENDATIDGSTYLNDGLIVRTGGVVDALNVSASNVDVFRDARVFGDLDVKGDVDVNSNITVLQSATVRDIFLGQGSASNLSLAFSSATDTGFFLENGNNHLAFSVNGFRNTLFTDDGIEVKNAVAQEFFGDGCNLVNLNVDNVGSGVLDVYNGGTGTTSHTASKLLIGAGSNPIQTSPQLHWNSSVQRLGVGSSMETPSEKLHVNGNILSDRVLTGDGTASDLAFEFATTSSPEKTGFYRTSGGDVEFSIDGERATRLVPSGLVSGQVEATSFTGDGSNLTNLDVDQVSLGVLDVQNGGSGQSNIAPSKLLVGNGSNAILSPSQLHWDGNNLGVGIVNPNHRLHVIGSLRATTLYGNGCNITDLDVDNVGSGVLNVQYGGTGKTQLEASKLLVGNGTSDVNSPPNLHWDSGANRLGINTSAPQYALDVNGSFSATTIRGDGNEITNLDVDNVGEGVLDVFYGGTGRSNLSLSKIMVGNGTNDVITPIDLHWDGTRLGVGTSAPQSRLQVQGTCTADFFVGDGNDVSNLNMDSAGTGILNIERGGTGAGEHTENKLIVGNSTDPLLSPTQLHWDPSTCNLGVRTDEPSDPLHVNGRARATSFIGDGNAITNLDMNNAGTGVLSVSRGGTGSNSHPSNKILVGDGTDPILSPSELHWTGVYLGIGTSTPSHLLHVNGHTFSSILTVTSNITAGEFIGDGNQITNLNLNDTAVILDIENGGTGRNSIDANKLMVGGIGGNSILTPNDLHFESGNLGVGTQSPTDKLHVVGTVRATSYIGDGSAISNLHMDNAGLGTLNVNRGGTGTTNMANDKVLVGNGSNAVRSSEIYWNGSMMGVGTALPVELLDVDGTTRTSNLIVTSVAEASFFEGDGSRLTNLSVNNVESGTLDVQYGGTGRTSFDSTKILVGNGVSPITSASSLYWTGNNLGINVPNPTVALEVNGGILASEDIVAESDAKIKTNLRPIRDALRKVGVLRGYVYNRSDLGEARSTENFMGMVAQEVKDVVPEVVKYNEQTDMHSLAYGNMVALLVEGMKEMHTTFSSKLTDLENKVNTLASLVTTK